MGDDSDDELEQRVDQLEQQLSQMLPGRRGVLKGLGAAAAGGALVGSTSGTASAQDAVGQIGTQSAPVDVVGGSVSADEQNNTELPPVDASIQNAIDEVEGDNGSVSLHSGYEYNEGEEIHIKPGVDLYFNGAKVVVESDHNGIFVDRDAKVHNLDLRVNLNNYTSDAVVLSTSRAGGTYGQSADVESVTKITGRINGSENSGVGLALRDDAGDGITLSTKIDLSITGFDTGLLGLVDENGFITAVDLWVSIQRCRVSIDHVSGSTGAGRMDNQIHGNIQGSSNSEVGIRNNTTEPSVNFYGQFWDGFNFDTGKQILGEDITLVTDQAPLDIEEGATNAIDSAAYVFDGDRFRMYDLEDGVEWQTRFENNRMELATRETGSILQVDESGQIRLVVSNGGHIKHPSEDLTNRDPNSGSGEPAYHDGSGTPSESLCFSLNSTTWYNLVDGNTF